MPSAGDIQRLVRNALVQGDDTPLAGLLVGGRDWRKRLAIHRRHYETSLVTALLDRFPATLWLIGSEAVTDAARRFVRDHPPARPCLAEYGDAFPEYLAGRPEMAELPYLRSFSELEWHLSRLSVAITRPALDGAALAALDPETLPDLTAALQPDLFHTHAAWAIDDLMRLYLTDEAPDRFSLIEGAVWLELRGARGHLRLARLDEASFVFRTALADGRRLGEAALAAFDVSASFDPGAALAALMADGLLTNVGLPDGSSRTS